MCYRKILFVAFVLFFRPALPVGSVQAAAPTAFAFGANNSWTIIYEDRTQWGYRGSRVRSDLGEAIDKMQQNEMILGVGMNENSWVLVGSKTWSGSNLPTDLDQYLRSQTSQCYQIIDVALTRAGGWVVISRRNGQYYWRSTGFDIPQELIDFLRHATNNNYRVLGAGITMSGGWAAAYRTSSRVVYRMRGVPGDAIEYTDEVDRK